MPSPEGMKPLEHSPEKLLGRNLSFVSRVSAIARDPKCHQAAEGVFRLGLNAAIGLGGLVPVIGDAAEVAVRTAKGFARIASLAGVKVKTDLTPDVAFPYSMLSGTLHIGSHGILPTYLLMEARIQAGEDLPRIKKGWTRALRHWRGEIIDELEDYIDNEDEYKKVRAVLDQYGIKSPWAATVKELRDKYKKGTLLNE